MSKCPAGSRSRRFATLHRFLTWALRSSDAMAPTLRFEKHERPKAPPSRQRFLDANEIRAIWDAAGKQRRPVLQDLVRFLVAVPCREGEASGMRWRDIGIDPTTGEPCWIMPSSKTGTPHRFHLPARAVALIAARRAAAGKDATGDALVFASPLSGKRFVSWSPLKRSLDLALGLPRPSAKAPKAPSVGRTKPRETPTKTASTSSPLVGQWRFHDLRRSCVTTPRGQNPEKFDADTLDLLINHRAARTRGGITGVYNLSLKWKERVTAMRTYDHWLDTALGESTQGAEGPRARHGNVIALPAAGFRRIAGP